MAMRAMATWERGRPARRGLRASSEEGGGQDARAPRDAAMQRKGMITCRYRSSLCLIAENATSGMTMNQMARLRRAYQSSGSSAGEHQRRMLAMYHHGAWYFTRDAKSGSTSVRWANLIALEKGVPQVSQS